jgi:ABC-type nitrate/sulfonate/bicarbonate transport system ATPase subunit
MSLSVPASWMARMSAYSSALVEWLSAPPVSAGESSPRAALRPPSEPTATVGRGALQLRRVSKRYEVDGKALDVLEGIDLAVEPGEFICIVGASGCGKSTILRLIVGLDTDHGGDILLDDRPIGPPGLERGIVFQEHRLMPWLTVEQNIALSLEATGRSTAERARLVQEHIDLVGLTGFERAFPRQLSGGMAQRVAIARGLVSQPKILLLDEPLGALDSLTRLYLQQELLGIWSRERITMVMVTHDVEEAAFLSDRIVVLSPRPGRVRCIIAVDLPHPRDRADPRFIAIRQATLNELSQ